MNIYFAETLLNLKDKWWDFFEFTEYALLMLEQTYSQNILRWTPNETPLVQREYA